MTSEKGLAVKKWSKTIFEKLSQDWPAYTFRVRFTKSNELLIQFEKPTKQNNYVASDRNPPPPIFPPPNNALGKYMHHFSTHGLAGKYGLKRRGDRWNIMEMEKVLVAVPTDTEVDIGASISIDTRESIANDSLAKSSVKSDNNGLGSTNRPKAISSAYYQRPQRNSSMDVNQGSVDNTESYEVALVPNNPNRATSADNNTSRSSDIGHTESAPKTRMPFASNNSNVFHYSGSEEDKADHDARTSNNTNANSKRSFWQEGIPVENGEGMETPIVTPRGDTTYGDKVQFDNSHSSYHSAPKYKEVYLLTYSFYAPWIGRGRLDAQRTASKLARVKANQYGNRQKAKYDLNNEIILDNSIAEPLNKSNSMESSNVRASFSDDASTLSGKQRKSIQFTKNESVNAFIEGFFQNAHRRFSMNENYAPPMSDQNSAGNISVTTSFANSISRSLSHSNETSVKSTPSHRPKRNSMIRRSNSSVLSPLVEGSSSIVTGELDSLVGSYASTDN